LGEHFNTLLRGAVGFALATLAVPLQGRAWHARKVYRFTQSRLRRKLGIRADTPVVDFAGTEARLAALRSQLGARAIEAQTSGTSRAPKRLLYTRERVARTRGVFLEVFTRLVQGLGIRRKSLFVMAPIELEPSLTSLLVAESRLPSRVACAQAPYRVERHRALDSVRARYGAVAVRSWLSALSAS